jgi:hypothetical protein
MKKFVLGFLTAALLFSAIPVGAAVQEYILTSTAAKITVDGEEVKNDTLPIMAYQGYNYIPAATFRDICGKIGVGFEWNNELKEIQITTTATSATAIATPQPAKVVTPTPTPSAPSTIEPVYINGVKLIFIRDVRKRLEEKGYNIFSSSGGKQLLEIWLNGKLILDNIPFDTYDGGKVYFKYDYYIENLLPLIE